MTDETTELVTADIADKILTLRFNRPDKKNALTHAMYARLVSEIMAAEENPSIRVIFITGSEQVFTAGNDITDFVQNTPNQDSPVAAFLQLLPTIKKPLVAAVNGPAIGIGSTLLLHCDLVYLGDQAKLQFPFVQLGICPEAGSSMLLPALVGQAKAAEIFLLGDKITAHQAHELGLANAVFPTVTYQQQAYKQALRLAAQPPEAVRITKELLRKRQRSTITEIVKEEAELVWQRLSSAEAREAMQAFLEKRPADFSRFE